jgi:hypothetical protein
MSTLNLTNTEGYFIRINFDDGDSLDQTHVAATGLRIRSEDRARKEAAAASRSLRATVDACKGATVLAEYRHGQILVSRG